MSVSQENTAAVLMLCTVTPRERSTAHVIRDIKETDENAQVGVELLFELLQLLQCMKE